MQVIREGYQVIHVTHDPPTRSSHRRAITKKKTLRHTERKNVDREVLYVTLRSKFC